MGSNKLLVLLLVVWVSGEFHFTPHLSAAQRKTTETSSKRISVPTIHAAVRFTKHGGEVVAVAFSPDGQTVASGGNERVRLWDVKTGKELRSFGVPPIGMGNQETLITALAFSPDGKSLASVKMGGPIRLWDVATGKLRRKFQVKDNPVITIAFSPNAEYLASATLNSVGLWNIPKGKQVHQFNTQRHDVRTLAFSASGRTLLGVGSCSPLEELERLPLEEEGRDTSQSSERQNATAIRLWTVATGKPMRVPRQGPWCGFSAVALAPNWRSMVLANYDRPKLGGFGGAPGLGGLAGMGGIAGIGGLAGVGGIAGIGGMAGGQMAVAGNERSNAFGESADTGQEHGPIPLGLWETATGKERCRFQKAPTDILSLTFSQDGSLLAAGTKEGVICLWDAGTGRKIARLRGHLFGVFDVVFSPDGKLLASASRDATARIWKVPLPAARERLPKVRLAPRELDNLWRDLASDDAPRAYKAIAALSRAPEQSAHFLPKRLHRLPQVRELRIVRLITDLGSARFKVRQQADRELQKLTDRAEPALRRTLQGRPELEVRRRVERLLAKLEPAGPYPGYVQALRALEVLERLGTPEARRALESLVRQPPDPRLVEEAKAALQRVK
jgi:WD40 repeat protein